MYIIRYIKIKFLPCREHSTLPLGRRHKKCIQNAELMLNASGRHTFGVTGWRLCRSQKFTIKNVNFYSLAYINYLICHSWNYYHSRQEIPATLVRSLAPLIISIFKMEFKSQPEELSSLRAKRISYPHHHIIVGYQQLYVG